MYRLYCQDASYFECGADCGEHQLKVKIQNQKKEARETKPESLIQTELSTSCAHWHNLRGSRKILVFYAILIYDFMRLKLRSFSHSRFEFDPLHFGLQRLQITAKSWDSTTALLVWALSRQSSWWRGEGSPFVEAFCRELLLLTAVLGHLKTCYK